MTITEKEPPVLDVLGIPIVSCQSAEVCEQISEFLAGPNPTFFKQEKTIYIPRFLKGDTLKFNRFKIKIELDSSDRDEDYISNDNTDITDNEILFIKSKVESFIDLINENYNKSNLIIDSIKKELNGNSKKE